MSASLKIATQMPLPLLDPVRQRFPEVEIVSIPAEGPVPEDLGAQVLLTMPWGTPNLRDVLATGIEWVHAYGTGVNGFPFSMPMEASRPRISGPSAPGGSSCTSSLISA